MPLYANKMETRDTPGRAATITVYGPAGMPLEGFCDQLGQILGNDTVKSDGPPAFRKGLPSFRFHYLAGHPLCLKAQANYKAGLPEKWLSLEEFAAWAGKRIGRSGFDGSRPSPAFQHPPAVFFTPHLTTSQSTAQGSVAGHGLWLLCLLVAVGFAIALAAR